MKRFLFTYYTPEEIATYRYRIKDNFLENSSIRHHGGFEAVSPLDIRLMFFLYDKLFFKGRLAQRVTKRIQFRFSNRMTKAGGKVTYTKHEKTYVLSLSLPLIREPFASSTTPVLVNGIQCKDSTDAMMSIMEHELIHILEFELYGSSSCGRRRFKDFAKRIFGHSDNKHHLTLGSSKKIVSMDITIGSKVTFEYNGTMYAGTIARITKRATVILDPSCNKKYERFYVPLENLSLQD